MRKFYYKKRHKTRDPAMIDAMLILPCGLKFMRPLVHCPGGGTHVRLSICPHPTRRTEHDVQVVLVLIHT